MIRKFNIVFIALLFSILISSSSSAQEKTKNVLDYYLDLPDNLFYCELSKSFSKEAKEKQIVRKNLPNGFILAKSEGYRMEVALFKDRTKNRDIIAVNIRCGEGCMCSRFEVLELIAGGKWKNVKEIFPSEAEITKALEGKGKSDAIYEIALPETGTTIQLIDSTNQKPLIGIIWKDGKFSVK